MPPSFLSNPDPFLLSEGLLHELFETTARRHPGRTAVECEGKILSYAELEARANRLARGLSFQGVGPGRRVCLLLPKSLELYAAVLGVLKAGASNVPVDPSTPPELYRKRLFIETFRVILPATAFVAFTTLILSFSVQVEDACGPLATILAFPLIYIGLGLVGTFLTALMKWLIVGRYESGEHPLWSGFVWRTELVTGFCENFTNDFFVQHLQGTVFLPWYYRLLGMKIGQRACLLTMDFSEFDLVRLGDDVALNEECTIQTHLIEDRVMKLGPIDIGSRASVGSFAVVLYGSALEYDVKVGDLSLVMKGERLCRGTSWAGSPVRRA